MKIDITIVTPTYNQGETIGETIESVLCQDMGNALEYIIVDGCSTDNTRDVIDACKGEIVRQGIHFNYIRENDNGQADAINKGWQHAGGNLLGYLNSDDLLARGALRNVLAYFSRHPHVQWAYGGWHLIGEHGYRYKTVRPRRFSRTKLLNYCNIGQPSCFFRRQLLREFGNLKEDLHLAMDYDLWLRFSARYEAGVISHVLSSMRYYAHAKSASQTKQQLREILDIGMKYTRPTSVRRLMQYFYYLRGLAVAVLGIDISNRILSAQKSNRRSNHIAG